MNTILQKRIEEAKQKEYPLPPIVDGAVCKVLAMAEQTAYKKGATFALQNQWISVEEALPKEDGDYIVTKYKDEKHYITCFAKWYNNKFNTSIDITHWMEIPKLHNNLTNT